MLPILGVDGSLATFCTHCPAKGKVFAKTGTVGYPDTLNNRLTLGWALAGYLEVKPGRYYAYDLVVNGFHQGLAKNDKPEPGREVLHSKSFLVVDHRGVIRGYVDGTNRDEVARLEDAVGRLVQAKYFPAVNAGLNATCGALLVLGYFLIKARRILAHKICMLAAVAVSAAFLACYLYYHFAVLDGQPTRFTGEGPVRYIYLGILVSHTLLAAAVAPLALRVTYLGLRDRLGRHVALARWTLPVWLYVSVTGVVVYWMLYHLYPPV